MLTLVDIFKNILIKKWFLIELKTFYLTQKLDYDNGQPDNNNGEKDYEPPNYNNLPPNYNNGPQYDNNRQNDYNRKAFLIIMDTFINKEIFSLFEANYSTLLDLTVCTRGWTISNINNTISWVLF